MDVGWRKRAPVPAAILELMVPLLTISVTFGEAAETYSFSSCLGSQAVVVGTNRRHF